MFWRFVDDFLFHTGKSMLHVITTTTRGTLSLQYSLHFNRGRKSWYCVAMSTASGPPQLSDRVVSLSRWWQEHQKSSSPPIRLLDLRPLQDQNKRPLCLSPQKSEDVVVSLPVELLKARSYELPARHIDFSILIQNQHLEVAESILMGIRPGLKKRLPNPWKVNSVLIDSEEFWKEAPALGVVTPGTTHHPAKIPFPQPRLWQPDPMVETILLPLLLQDQSKKLAMNETLQVLDLASGSGRDVAFLAEELSAKGISHCRVVGIDHRYNEKETNIVRSFWERRGVKAQTHSIKLDLSQVENIEDALALSKIHAMFCVRFWKRELVRAIATSCLLSPGVLFGLSHFCKPYRAAPWEFDHPSEKTVLERDELSKIFVDGWEIVHDQIAMDSDHGRTMIQFVAIKR